MHTIGCVIPRVMRDGLCLILDQAWHSQAYPNFPALSLVPGSFFPGPVIRDLGTLSAHVRSIN